MNSQEKELLLQAAKPLGYFLLSVQGNKLNMTKDHKKNFHWNPLTDDGDAFRLAVKLQISLVVKTYPHCITVSAYDYCSRVEPQVEILWDSRGDLVVDAEKATRLAVVKLAASIGRNMK